MLLIPIDILVLSQGETKWTFLDNTGAYTRIRILHRRYSLLFSPPILAFSFLTFPSQLESIFSDGEKLTFKLDFNSANLYTLHNFSFYFIKIDYH